ncbi:MAG: alpha/beta fold hydrolase [Salaquimonas sp.]
MKRFLKIIGVILVLIVLAYSFGPRPDNSQNITFKADNLPDDLDAYLEDTESRFADLKPNVSKEIIWNNPVTKAVTDVAIVYIHGFSATKQEIQPVPQEVAKALGANLFLTRLTGHGRSGDALAEATMSDWLDDTAEAIAIGKRIGKKVILISTSTGGSLSVLAATHPELSSQIEGLAMISPNFAIHGAPTWLMNIPFAETILPILLGAERSFEPRNRAHAAGWTHTYPSAAVFPMAALLRTLDSVDYSALTLPALFIYSNEDTVVVADKTKEVIKQWGGSKSVTKISDSNDPNNHVIAGDILSPNTTQRVFIHIYGWVRRSFMDGREDL